MQKVEDVDVEMRSWAGHDAWVRRVKYATVAEVYEEVRAANVEDDIKDCPVEAYLKDHLDDDVISVEDHIWGHPEWGPQALCSVIRNTITFNNAASHVHGEEIARAVQYDAALALTRHPWEAVRPHVERLLRHRHTRIVSPKAAYVLIAYFVAHHPNAGGFLDRDGIREKLPADLQLDRFPRLDLRGAPPVVG